MLDADPMFVDADGPDNVPGTEDDDLRLLPGSPAIDAGDNSAVPPNVTTDLDGNPRFVDDPATADTGVGPPPVVDMGACEFGSAPCIPADLNCDGSVDLRDFARCVLCFDSDSPLACDPFATPDLNGDVRVDLGDHVILMGILTGPG